jgi:hypothetical protein
VGGKGVAVGRTDGRMDGCYGVGVKHGTTSDAP